MSDNCPECGHETKYHAWTKTAYTECKFCGWSTTGLYEPDEDEEE